MTSIIQSNSATSQQEFDQRKKRRKLTHETHDNSTSSTDVDNNNSINKTRWRTESEQRIYSSKLYEALRRSRRSSPTPETAVSPAVKGRKIRDTAYRVLAVAAKGTSKWSRAILAGKVRLRVKKVRQVKVTGDRRKEAAVSREKKRLPPVDKKMRVLSRLVPGCRKASFTNILEETSDYIVAVEMQIKAMAALVEILAASGGRGGESPVDPANSQL
ncbi:transcription factor bHLH149 [Mercurialis annua]|uniref:transcription factor bHLH149 n=1 Tax=Mercurialis annua TaxID=3986 RepID=UPI00215E3E04|nr:transcription factor bHLH149 [Mercurialis annua]